MASNSKKTKVSELGKTGLRISGGMIYEEFLPQLRGRQGIAVYREMLDNDPIIGAMMFSIEMLIRNVKWSMAPASDTDIDKAHAQFVEECMHDMEKPWGEVINDILPFISFGFGLQEVVMKVRLGKNNPNKKFRSKYNDGRLGWRKLPSRAQESISKWVYDEDNREIIEVHQQTRLNGNAIIPYEKLLHFRTNSRLDNPEGKSALRSAYKPWYMRKLIEEFEGVGIERDLQGIPVMGVHVDYFNDEDEDKKATLEKCYELVEGIRINEDVGVVYPIAYDENGNKMFELDLLTSNGKKNFDTNAIIERYNSSIAQTLLADFILMGHKSAGSFALSSDKTKLFSVAISAWLDNIAEVFNKKAIPDLFKANKIELDEYPKLVFSDIEKKSLDAVSQYVERCIRVGAIMPTDALESHLLGLADLPQRDKDAEVLDSAASVQNDKDREIEQAKIDQVSQNTEEGDDNVEAE